MQGAYLVSLLHALKYPANTVNGVLLGSFEKDGTVQVSQALPLLHSHVALAPMMDAALALIDEHCQAAKVKIVGYYHANANHHHKAPSPVAVRIADKLHDVVRQESKGAEPCLLMIDNLQLERMGALMASGEASEELCKTLGMTLYTKRNNGVWEVASGATLDIDGASSGAPQARLVELVAKGSVQEVVDFDNHIDDSSRPWLTPCILE